MTIFMIGDSLMQTNNYETYPQTGWGQALNLFVKEDVKIINLAKNGTSTKSFIDQGRFQRVEKEIQSNDLLIIGFAHNDEKINDPLRYTSPYGTFMDNLSYFINTAINKGANVILTTPIIRRKYEDGKLIDTHLEYVDAIRKCAIENDVDIVDLNKLTKNYFNTLDEESSKRYFMHFAQNLYDNYPEGRSDDSHLRFDGAYLICKMFVNEVYKLDLKCKDYFFEIKKFAYCANDIYEK